MGDAKWGREPNREYSIHPIQGPGYQSRHPKGYTASRECPDLEERSESGLRLFIHKL